MSRKKKKKSNPLPTIASAEVMRAFRKGGKPMATGEVMRVLGLTKRFKKPLRDALWDLVKQGKLIRIRGAFGLLDNMSLITGKLTVLRSGAGFVIPEDSRRKDLFISEHDLGDAWHGDRVVAAVTSIRKHKSNEGRIVRILERGKQTFPARVVRPMGKNALLLRPMDPRLNFGMVAEVERNSTLAKDDIVLAAPGERIDPALWEARILSTMGREDDIRVQEAVVKVNNGVPTDFPDDAHDQARNLPDAPDSEDFRDRRDFREMNFVTIDGADARDFDDAVFVERQGKGYRLWVAIADVSHYVRQGTALDVEAYDRGNSYYFPRSVEPMFPEKLSNGLCSLNPGVDRLAMVVSMDFDKNGNPGRCEMSNAVINSKARLTYGQVKRAVLDRDEAESQAIMHVMPMLKISEELARKLTTRRKERGSLDFDLPEAIAVFDESDRLVDVRPRERNYAHRIIEEFMIAANEAVAGYLTDAGLPCLYRIHPEADQDKISGLYKILTKINPHISRPDELTPAALQTLLNETEGTGVEFLANRLALRSMKLAQYSPENEGHFGLASECYCHFTSPIRRYADLVVHRQLKRALNAEAGGIPGFKKLKDISDQLNTRERVAVDAEREIYKRVAVLFLRDRIGDEFEGIISSLSDYGFRVEIPSVMAEGMVRLSTMNDDYYAYWKDEEILVGARTGRTFGLGGSVKVRLDSADIGRLEIDFTLLEGGIKRGRHGKKRY